MLLNPRMMLLDNIAKSFGGSSLDAALTGTMWRDRILGRSEMTSELPLFAVWYATGNNVALKGDAIRRVVACRLETREERPEERRDFTIRGDLLQHVQELRTPLVTAALTILRAHAVAGRPDPGLVPLGSYESWCEVIRNAVYWATDIDPCGTREKLRESDPEASVRLAVMEGWAELPGGQSGTSAAEVLKLLKANAGGPYQKLYDALLEWGQRGELPSAHSLGRRLSALKGQPINGRCLVGKLDRGTWIWHVQDVNR